MINRTIAHLNVIGVEFGPRQAVEGAEVQTTGEDSVRTAALPVTRNNMARYTTAFPCFSSVLFISRGKKKKKKEEEVYVASLYETQRV